MLHTEMVNNIKAYYYLSTRLERIEGAEWYADASRTAKTLAGLYNETFSTVVGIIAALSPRNKWVRNVIDAEGVLAFDDFKTATFKANKVKAYRIKDGEKPLDVLSGNKVRSFYHCIVDPSTDDVCVDGHAWAVACGFGERVQVKRISDTEYTSIQSAYCQAALELGVSPTTLQATTWLAYRRIHRVA